jgi:hypothetical protein
MQNTTRRKFISDVGLAAVAVGSGATLAGAQAPAKAAAHAAFHPARHTMDDWLDAAAGKHRIIIDAVTAAGAGSAILFANNLYQTNKDAYKMADGDLAIVIVMRHFATPFAFSEAFWAKYGSLVGGMLAFNDPKTQKAPTTNVYQSAEYGMTLPSFGNTITGMIGRGTRLAICEMATHFFAGEGAKAMGSTPDAVYKEFVASALPNHQFVPAGVVALNRAQERGYTMIYAG